MPVKTKRDEEKWQKAKEIAKEQGQPDNWALVMGIYKKMKPDYEFKSGPAVKTASSKYDHIDFKPPQGVADAAEKGLEYRKKQKGDKAGLTPTEAAKEGIGSGVQRAVNLKNRDTVSPEVIKQMKAFFARHQKNKAIAPEHKNEPWKDKGYVAWLLWGGDAGQAWAEKVVGQMEAADKKKTARVEHISQVIRDYFKRRLGRQGKLWDTVSRGDTFQVVFPDDQGTWPGRGGGRFTTLFDLVRKFGPGMPSEVEGALHDLIPILRKEVAVRLDDEGLMGTNKLSFRWKTSEGEDEEWSIQLSDEVRGRTAARVAARYQQAALISDAKNFPTPGVKVTDVSFDVAPETIGAVKFEDGSEVMSYVDAKDVASLMGVPEEALSQAQEFLEDRNLRLEVHKFASRMMQGADPKGMYLQLLALLRALQWLHWTTHWKTSGATYYGDHLLFERLYIGDDEEESPPIEEIDGLGEKIIAYYGPDAIDPLEQTRREATIMEILTRGSSGLIQRALMAEEILQGVIKMMFERLEEEDKLPLGMNDYLAALASAHETNVYLLKQRLLGGRVAARYMAKR